MSLFKEKMFYIYRPSIKKVQGPYATSKEAELDYEDGDSLIQAIACDVKGPALRKATVNFNNKTVTVDGVFKDFLSGTYEIPETMLSTILSDLYRETKKVTVIGVPPLKGVCLDEVLYM